jgi:hypothetical protein
VTPGLVADKLSKNGSRWLRSFILQLTFPRPYFSSPYLDQATAQSPPTTGIEQLRILRSKRFAKYDAQTPPMIRRDGANMRDVAVPGFVEAVTEELQAG